MFAFYNSNGLSDRNCFNFVFLYEKRKKTYGFAEDLWVEHTICHMYWTATKLLDFVNRKSILAV